MGRPRKVDGLVAKARPAELDLEAGKLYLNGKDVWAINTDMGEWVQVHIREQIFKVRLSNLVIFDNGNEEENV
jgi:hypothetical protein